MRPVTKGREAPSLVTSSATSKRLAGEASRPREPRPAGHLGEEPTNYKEEVKYILDSQWFDVAIGIVIVLNAISIGAEQTLQLLGLPTTVTTIFESAFLLIYIIELTMRLYAHGTAALKQTWVQFDVFLVFVGVIGSWILDPFVSGEASRAVGPIMVLRTMRLLRLAKTLRLFARVQECWMLVRGFMNSSNVLIYSFVILFIVLYIFSCLSIELITKRSRDSTDTALQAHVDRYFSSLPHSMLTLIRFVCLDNASEVYQPIVEKEPILGIFFVAIIFTVSVVMFHLLGAVIFSSTLDQNAYERDSEKVAKEDEWAKLIQDLKAMFIRLDEDQSGYLSKDELLNIDPKDQAKLTEALGVSTPLQVFNALDVDKSGEVSISEFFDGIWEVVIGKSGVEIKRMEKQIEAMHWRLKETFVVQHELQVMLMRLFKQLETVGAREPMSPGGCSQISGYAGWNGVPIQRPPFGINTPLGVVIKPPTKPQSIDKVEKVPELSPKYDSFQTLSRRMEDSWQEHVNIAMCEMRAILEQARSDLGVLSPGPVPVPSSRGSVLGRGSVINRPTPNLEAPPMNRAKVAAASAHRRSPSPKAPATSGTVPARSLLRGGTGSSPRSPFESATSTRLQEAVHTPHQFVPPSGTPAMLSARSNDSGPPSFSGDCEPSLSSSQDSRHQRRELL